MTDSEIPPEIVELILRTSRVKDCENVYSLAPRGHRVGVYFQQRRATLLAAALRSRLGRDKFHDTRIGIVGGGVSGLTFLLAAHHEGARSAFLYEATDALLTIGATAPHRLIHPNYNRWPLLGSMDAFTALPVLNWHAATADNVIKQMKLWLADPTYTEIVSDKIQYQTSVKTIVQRSNEYLNPVRIHFTNSSGCEHNNDYSIVIIAAGFARERCIDLGFNDYWTKEPHAFDNSTHKTPCTIYGIGDGALIDLVRCCAMNPDAAWEIPLGTIARLRPDHTRSLSRTHARKDSLNRPSFSAIEKAIQSHEESIRSVAWQLVRPKATLRDAYLLQEARFYNGCIDTLKAENNSVIKFLNSHFKPVAPNAALRPHIISDLPSPFEPTSAPINKLLAAYLLQSGRAVHERRARSTVKQELHNWTNQSALERQKHIIVCRFGADKNFPSSKALAQPTAILVYREVDRKLRPVQEDSSESTLIDAMSAITGGEYIYYDTMPHPSILARHSSDPGLQTHAIRRQNSPVIQSFVQRNIDSKCLVEYRSGGSNGAPQWVVMTDLNDEEISNKITSVGGLDGQFIGVPLVVAGNAGSIDSGGAF